ncbi:MAG: hypothetical protein GY864_15220 [Desulfobacterales bacterium]|nr:hypothetical protein [Desulfobacterales bacterium]
MGQFPVEYFFKKPDRILPDILDRIQALIERGQGVGLSYIRGNLQKAFMIAYAMDRKGLVVGTVTLKSPKEEYRKKIEKATGLDLSGYLERGYTSIEPGAGPLEIADTLIKGLTERSRGKKMYVTIRMDNTPALRLTQKNRMTLAAKFFNQNNHEIGVFLNARP